MSAARLAAETAFSVSRQPSSEPPPTITVRRSRGFSTEVANAEAAPGAEQAALASKGPRIFRLGSSTAAAAKTADVESAPVVAGSQFTEAEEIPAIRRKRRVAAHQRPGPVVQIFKAPADDRGDDDHRRDAAAVGDGVTHAQLAFLAEMLADVQSVLDDIQRARAFRVLDTDSVHPLV